MPTTTLRPTVRCARSRSPNPEPAKQTSQTVATDSDLARIRVSWTLKPRLRATEVQIVSENQLPVLLERLKGNKVEPIVLLALFCGLRRGEILALRWGDIDLHWKVL